MKIIALDTFALPFVGFIKGRQYEIADDIAERLIKDGLIKSVDAEPAETEKPKVKKNGRKQSGTAGN